MLNYSKKLDRRILTLGIFICTIFLLATTIQTDFAADQTINDTSTGGILQGITDTGTGDTLYLNPGTYNKSNQDTNISISKNITIQGNGSKDTVIIDAKGLSRIFIVSSNSNVTLINITFINGNTTGDGGALISSVTSNLAIINCVFINNNASAGGGIHSAGNLTVKDSNFINNTVAHGGGGAISMFNSDNDTYNYIITNSTFENNSAISAGGAFYISVYNTDGKFIISIIDAIFINNSANYGGSIYCNPNGIVYITIINSSITNGTGFIGAGGIASSGRTNLTISNSSILGNIGNGISAAGGSNITISGSSINNNSKNGIQIENAETNVTISDSEIVGNGDNGIFNERGTLNITGSNVSNNTNDGIKIANTTINSNIENNTINNNGENGISNSGNTTIIDNVIVGNGGFGVSNNGTVIMKDNTISNNENQESILAINSSVSGRVVSVTVKATDVLGNILVGATVNFYVDGVLVGTGITDNDGVAQFIYTATKAGTNNILAVMEEFSIIDVDNNEFIYSTVSNTTSEDIAKFNTNVTIVVSNATAGKQTIVRGVLVDENGNPIANASLNVVIGGNSYSVVTGADGKWELPYAPSKAGNYNAKVYYSGDFNYLASTGSVAYTVAQEQEDTPTKVDIRLVKRNNSKAVRHGNVVYMKWLTFKNFGASGSQTINAKIIIKNLKYKLWKVYNKKINYKFAKNNIKFKLNLKSNGIFKLKLKVYRPIKQK